MAFNPYIARGRSAYRNISGAQLLRTAALPDDAAFTACGWAVLDVDTNAFSSIITLESGTASAANGLYLETEADGTTLEIVATGTGASLQLRAEVVGRPFFWALVSSGTAAGTTRGHTRRLWERAFTTAEFSVARTAFVPAALFLGNSSFGESLDGRLWGVRVWDAALTAHELMVESLSSVPVRLRQLHGWWPLEGGFNQLIADRSGNGKLLTRTSGRVAPFFLPNSVLSPLPMRQAIMAAAAAGGGGRYAHRQILSGVG